MATVSLCWVPLGLSQDIWSTFVWWGRTQEAFKLHWRWLHQLLLNRVNSSLTHSLWLLGFDSFLLCKFCRFCQWLSTCMSMRACWEKIEVPCVRWRQFERHGSNIDVRAKQSVALLGSMYERLGYMNESSTVEEGIAFSAPINAHECLFNGPRFLQ